MKKIKKNQLYLIGCIFFLTFLICYIFRYEITHKTFSLLGYDEVKVRRYSFLILEKPFRVFASKLRAKSKMYFSSETTLDSNEVFNNALEIKLGFLKYNNPNLEFKNGNYFLNIFKPSKVNNIIQSEKLEYSSAWKGRFPSKIWTIGMSNKTSSGESSSKMVVPLITQATPKICGNKLIYARQDGNIGAVDYRTGNLFWHKKFENVSALAIKGFSCEYEKKLDTYVIFYPTGSGVFCLNAADGLLITSRCKDGRLGGYESRVSPQLVDNTVYVATVRPSGIAAYNFFNGKLKWRTDFEIGKFFPGYGSNPWSNFTIDEKNQLLFVNTGSPSPKYQPGSSEKYKYSNSLLALRLKDGKIIWQFQETSKDTGNLDFVGKPVLLEQKIKGKDVVVTFSKTGSIFFIDRSSGLPIFDIEEKTINFGDFAYNFKQPNIPQSLANKNYYDYLNAIITKRKSNTVVFGYSPPILKLHRISITNVIQWPGAAVDTSNNYLILSTNNNYTSELYIDFVPKPPLSLPKNEFIKQCTSCHESKGQVNVSNQIVTPSLFLTTQIYEASYLNNYLKNNKFHKNINFDKSELLDAYELLKSYDKKIIKNKKYRFFSSVFNESAPSNKDAYLKSGVLGTITAISLDTGQIVWQIPAGTHIVSDSEIIVGSQSYGGITYANLKSNENVSFFTGSNDKKIYAINNNDGKYLWSGDLPASGSGIPLVYETNTERWIFVVATGGRIPNDKSDSIVAFKQKLN